MKKVLFLDRDGIINVDHGYVYKTEEFEFVPEIFDVCIHARDLGYHIIVITNQSGIARGKYSVAEFDTLSKWMCEQFEQRGVIIDDVFHCPHHPTKGKGDLLKVCDCRKPEPGMILSAAKKHNVDLNNSIFIGDKISDMQAANAAGINNRILVASQYGDQSDVTARRVDKIAEVLAFIV